DGFTKVSPGRPRGCGRGAGGDLRGHAGHLAGRVGGVRLPGARHLPRLPPARLARGQTEPHDALRRACGRRAARPGPAPRSRPPGPAARAAQVGMGRRARRRGAARPRPSQLRQPEVHAAPRRLGRGDTGPLVGWSGPLPGGRSPRPVRPARRGRSAPAGRPGRSVPRGAGPLRAGDRLALSPRPVERLPGPGGLAGLPPPRARRGAGAGGSNRGIRRGRADAAREGPRAGARLPGPRRGRARTARRLVLPVGDRGYNRSVVHVPALHLRRDYRHGPAEAGARRARGGCRFSVPASL
ncbi:MAG: hypothetical protein AVDCRST_MAG25-2834, partial [uncultured Rubrobacteraceae bacterium]